jgi:hypothetical protein
MKKTTLFCLLLACIGLESCKKDQSEKVAEAAKAKAEEIISTECYKALYEKDTIDLKINTLKNGKITGEMQMMVVDMPVKHGEIAGEFRGDTLFASYTFIQGGYEKKTYKNPMAFLKKGDELIIGNGKLMTTLGATHFIKGEPIDFDRVKYKLTKVDCVANDK